MGGVIINHPHQTSLLSSLYAMGAISILSRRYEKTHELTHPTPPLRSKNIFRTMFGWFGEVGGTKKKSYASMCFEFLLFSREKSQKNNQNHFSSFNSCNSSPILIFVPETPNLFCWKYKKTRTGIWIEIRAVKSWFGAIWCHLVSNRIPVFEPKNKEFELEFRLLVPPEQYSTWFFRISVCSVC